jgi:hypothetical protein
MGFFHKTETITPADKKVVFTGFTDNTIPGSIRKYCLCFMKCSASERAEIEKKLKSCGARLFGISGHDELALIFPDSWKISDASGAYLKTVAVEIERPHQGSLEAIAGGLLAYAKAQSAPPPTPNTGDRMLPDVTNDVIAANLFELLGDRPIASNVAAMFVFTRAAVGGKIELVDLYFENGIILWNVRIVDDKTVFIPAAYKAYPIKTVGVADLERHMESPPMRAESSH